MSRRQLVPVLLLVCALACAKKEQPAETAAPPPAAAATASAPPAADQNAPSLTSFSAGALIVQKPQEFDASWSAFWLLDGRGETGWATPEHVVTPQTIVIALPEKTLLDRLEFDTSGTDGDDGRGAKDITVEMSDVSATDGFQKIADVSLKDKTANQSFPTSAQVPGRWVRLNVKNNNGSKDYIELCDFRGYGKQLTTTPFANASGTYASDYGNFHLRQEGTSVTGCYEHDEGTLNGGIEGRVMHFTWHEAPDDKGPAMMVFTPDGQQMFGLWWNDGDTSGRGSSWDGKKISNDVGTCPHWSGGAEAQITKELTELGRTRIYGINFDVDSAHLKDESKPTLDKIVAMLKAKPDWKLKIEGHTDSTGSEERNKQLSEQRADAVKTYLGAAGIDAARLTTAGFGSSQPVGPNTTENGRAQNRRVELAKE